MDEHHQPFEQLKQISDNGSEFWSARDLLPLLGYKEWRNFHKVIAKAIVACETSGHQAADHFVDTNKMVELGSGAIREIEDIYLSRYACYLVVQNGDPTKPVVAVECKAITPSAKTGLFLFPPYTFTAFVSPFAKLAVPVPCFFRSPISAIIIAKRCSLSL